MDLPEKVEVKGGHAIIVGDAREEVHEDELRVALAAVAWLLVVQLFLLRAAFHDNERWRALACDGCGKGNQSAAAIKVDDARLSVQHLL